MDGWMDAGGVCRAQKEREGGLVVSRYGDCRERRVEGVGRCSMYCTRTFQNRGAALIGCCGLGGGGDSLKDRWKDPSTRVVGDGIGACRRDWRRYFVCGGGM